MSDEISTEKGRGGVMKKDELEEIYRLYYKDIYLYALSLARNRQDAEELASDAFYKALLSLETKSGSVKYWLFSVCRNLFLDQMRRRKRHPCEELSDKQTDDLEDTLAHLIREEEARKIYSCIQKLPDAYREIYGGDGQLMLDLSVYTEMHNPGYIVNQAHAEPDWFGKYGLSVTWGRLFTGEEEKAYINLVRGKVKESGNVERSFKGTSIYHAIGTKLGMVIYEGKDDTSMDLAKAELQNQQEHIAALPESAYLAVNITFPEAKTVEEMLKFADQYQDVSIIYNYVESKTGALQMNGFGFERAGIIPDQTEEINQKYPYLWTLGEDMDSGDRAEKWTLHYESMLKYLSERGEFIDMMTDAVSGWSSVDYKEELETVKKEGIHIVGMQIHGKRQDILDIIASGEIDGMDILDVKVSEYSR